MTLSSLTSLTLHWGCVLHGFGDDRLYGEEFCGESDGCFGEEEIWSEKRKKKKEKGKRKDKEKKKKKLITTFIILYYIFQGSPFLSHGGGHHASLPLKRNYHVEDD